MMWVFKASRALFLIECQATCDAWGNLFFSVHMFTC